MRDGAPADDPLAPRAFAGDPPCSGSRSGRGFAPAYGLKRDRSITFLILCCPTQVFTLDSRSMSVASIW